MAEYNVQGLRYYEAWVTVEADDVQEAADKGIQQLEMLPDWDWEELQMEVEVSDGV